MEIEKLEGFEKIYQVDCFKKEFEQVTSETKTNGRYHKWIRKKLSILESLGTNALKLEEFEKLSDTSPNLYSIRYPHSKKNPRVIYIYVEQGMVYLLHAFKEKNDSDYKNAINIAQKRAKLFI